MAIDPRIALGVQPMQLQQPDPGAGLNSLAKMMQISGAMDEQKVNALALQMKQREIADADKLNAQWASAVSPDGTINRNTLYTGMASQGLGSKIPGVQKQFLEADEARGKVQEQARKGYALFQNTIGSHFSNPNVTHDGVLGSVQALVDAGALDSGIAQKLAASLPQDPAQLRPFLRQVLTSQMTPEQMLTVFAPKPTEVSNGQQKVFRDTNPNSPTYGQNTGGAPVQMQMTPGEVATDRRAGAQLAQAERHFQAGENAPQYMETDAGLVALPKKLAPGQQPTGTPVLGAGGQPLGKPLKDIPPAVNSAIIQNNQSLNQIDRALTLLEGTDVGTQKGDKSATGVKGYLPQGILNRLDPGGVDARAEVADIGSLKIHDRSGAAVTVSESPRLMPFIPQATDDQVTVQKKLRRLRTEIANEAQAFQQTYSKEQGYKPSPVQPGKPAGNVTVTNW